MTNTAARRVCDMQSRSSQSRPAGGGAVLKLLFGARLGIVVLDIRADTRRFFLGAVLAPLFAGLPAKLPQPRKTYPIAAPTLFWLTSDLAKGPYAQLDHGDVRRCRHRLRRRAPKKLKPPPADPKAALARSAPVSHGTRRGVRGSHPTTQDERSESFETE
jgi:hypothetical protein